MNFWIVIVALAAGWLRGTKEGMVMTKFKDYRCDAAKYPGVRAHHWFRWYHAISVGVILSFMVLGIQLWYNWSMIPLALFLIWEAYETAYPWTRWGVLINSYPEHITLVDLVSLHYHSPGMHLFRWTFILALTWRML